MVRILRNEELYQNEPTELFPRKVFCRAFEEHHLELHDVLWAWVQNSGPVARKVSPGLWFLEFNGVSVK